MHEADIAELLLHVNKKDDRHRLFQLINTELRGEVLVDLEDPIMEQILDDLEISEKSEIINQLDSDDATDILSAIDEEEQEQVLEQVDDEQKEELLELLAYEISINFVTIVRSFCC
jgi:magnesium transporter